MKEETEQALSWKQDSILGRTNGLWAICPVSMETTYQLENQALGRKSPRALHCLKEYPNYLCNWIESYILLCLLGYDHKPIDNCPLLTIWRRQWQPTPVLRLKAYESRVNFDCICLFPLFRLVSGNLGRWVWACTLRLYKVFTKTGRGPWLWTGLVIQSE